MAIDYSGLFATPTDLRNKRMDALQQQRAQVGTMGGSMAGLLGQVAAGGGALGAQLAENIGQGFGLQTRQEKEAVKDQVAMQDVMSGNLVKMKNLRTKLGQTKNADPRMLMVLNQRIDEAEAKVKAGIDRDRQISREAAQDSRAEQASQRAEQASQRAAQQFQFTVEDRETAATVLEKETKAQTAKRGAAVKYLKDDFPDFAGLVAAGFPAEDYLKLASESKKLDLTEVGTYNNGTQEFMGGVSNGQLMAADGSGQFVPVGNATGIVQGKLTAAKGSGEATKGQIGQVTALANLRQGASALIEAATPQIKDPDGSFFGGTIPDPKFKEAFLSRVAQRANDIVADSKGAKNFGVASSEAMDEALKKLEDELPVTLSPEARLAQMQEENATALALGGTAVINGILSRWDKVNNEFVPVEQSVPANMDYSNLVNQYSTGGPTAGSTVLTGPEILQALKGYEGGLTEQDKANMGGYGNYLK
jgi:hypothetical protein